MEEMTAQSQVAETGRLLLRQGLVVRTWGNFSARTDAEHFIITPSGLGYEHMQPEDTVRYCLTDDSFEGSRKPSSEKGIHAAAYRLFPEAGFVIHTHQTYATALGLTGPESLALSAEEETRLGGIGWAAYGLPGTGKLKKAVAGELARGKHTVLMAHHGALICGRDRAEALERAALLEELCRRSCKAPEEPLTALAALGRPLTAQLDDMAQMLGRRLPVARTEEEAGRLLRKKNAVLLPGTGLLVRGEDAEDGEALRALARKAAVSALHCRACGRRAALGLFDCLLMRCVYMSKYSKRKKG